MALPNANYSAEIKSGHQITHEGHSTKAVDVAYIIDIN